MEGSSVLLEQEDVKGQGCPRTGLLSTGKFWISAPLNGLAPHSFLDEALLNIFLAICCKTGIVSKSHFMKFIRNM